MTTIDDLPPTTLAGLPRRTIASAIDFPFWLVGMVATVLVIALANGGELSGSGAPVVWFIVIWSALWETAWTAIGGTPGKRIAGFSVRALDGSRLSVSRSLGRTLIKYVQVYLFLGIFVSIVMIARSPRAQALHDVIVGSACFERAALEMLSSPQAGRSTSTGVPPMPALPATRTPPSTSTPEHRGPFL